MESTININIETIFILPKTNKKKMNNIVLNIRILLYK